MHLTVLYVWLNLISSNGYWVYEGMFKNEASCERTFAVLQDHAHFRIREQDHLCVTIDAL